MCEKLVKKVHIISFIPGPLQSIKKMHVLSTSKKSDLKASKIHVLSTSKKGDLKLHLKCNLDSCCYFTAKAYL